MFVTAKALRVRSLWLLFLQSPSSVGGSDGCGSWRADSGGVEAFECVLGSAILAGVQVTKHCDAVEWVNHGEPLFTTCATGSFFFFFCGKGRECVMHHRA